MRGSTSGCQCASPLWPCIRITYALANSPNRLVTTARNTQRPTRGADDVVVSWLPARTPRSAQGFSSSRWISSHHTVMAVSIAITMAVIIALTSSASDALPALAERRRVTSRRLVLRNVVLVLAGDAVVVRPAVDDRQLRPPVAVHRRRVRRLPFERRRLPR